MTARELLESYGGLTDRLEDVLQELDLCRLRAKSEPEGAERWRSRARVLSAQARTLKRQVHARQEDIQQTLMLLTDPLERKVLTMRYLDRLSYREISAATRFSERTIYRGHHSAVETLDLLMAKNQGSQVQHRA